MRFEILVVPAKRNGKGDHWYPVNFQVTPVSGIRALDFVRRELGLPELDVQKVKIQANRLTQNMVSVFIDEKNARASGLFQNNQVAQIFAEVDLFKDFFTPKLEVSRNENTGEVIEACAVMIFDERIFLEYWQTTGFSDKMSWIED